MKYTVLGKTALKVSRLGFGCMRLPMTSEGKVDRAKTIPMLHKAVDLGINYFDTAIFYCNGDSQRVLGEAFESMREKVVLSTKNHLHEADNESWWSRLEESLRLLRTDTIDVYNLHGMSWKAWERNISGPDGKLKLLEKARNEGKIRHICCSFHDSAEALLKLARTGVFESITMQYNLLDRSLEDAIHEVHKLGVGVVVMGPVGGGRLGVESERIRELTEHAATSTPEAALRFVLAHPGVNVALSGMSSEDMLEENVRTVSEKEAFSPDLIKRIGEEVETVRAKLGVQCPACGYCQPCPFGVDIPGNFAVYNRYRIYGLREHAEKAYRGLAERAALCTECGACLSKCPQKIQIPDVLRRVVAELDAEFGDFGCTMSITGARDGVVETRLTVKNLGEDALQPVVCASLDDGAQCEPPVINPGSLAPMSAVSETMDIRVPDGIGALRGVIETTAGEQARSNAVCLPFFLASSDRLRWHVPLLKPSDFSGRDDILETHGYRAGLQHDDTGLRLVLDIRSALHALARPGEAGGGRIELYVDMRPQDGGLGTAPYARGVDQFMVSLGEAGHGTQSGETYDLDQVNEPTDEGVRVSLLLRYADFLGATVEKPTRIGLDIMFVVADSDGTELGHPTYGLRQGLWRNPRLFAPAYLV